MGWNVGVGVGREYPIGRARGFIRHDATAPHPAPKRGEQQPGQQPGENE